MNTDKWKRNTAVLELDENARLSDIQIAYRRLVMRYHPDLNRAHNAVRRFREVVEAYRNLVELSKVEKAPSAEVSAEDALERVVNDPLIRRLSSDELEERLRYSSSPKLRAVAAIAIGMKRGEGWKKLLFESLRDSDRDVCVAALQMLARNLQLRDIVKLTSKLFGFKDRTIRRHAAKMIVRSTFRAKKGDSFCSKKSFVHR